MGLMQLDLIRREQERETDGARTEDRAGPETEGLLRRLERMYARPAAGAEEEHPPVLCAGGYVRRSPLQPYRTPPGYRRRMLLRAGLAVLAAVLAAAALWGIWNSGLLRS